MLITIETYRTCDFPGRGGGGGGGGGGADPLSPSGSRHAQVSLELAALQSQV